MSVWILVVGVALVGLVWSQLHPDPLALADRAAKTGDVEPVLKRLAGAGPTDWHRVIKRMWDGYHREAAVLVAKAFAQRHNDAPTAHFWISQFKNLEPEIAAANLEPEFMDRFFDPKVAACCGSYG
ncbi:MAG: hypothetical protein ACOZNI_00085 [Myxococcota bacterium]